MPKVGPPADSRDEFAADSPLQRRVGDEPCFMNIGEQERIFEGPVWNYIN
jgi:hypothetical protein